MEERFDEELLLGYVEDELSPDQQSRLDRMLAANPSLRKLLDEMKADRDLLREVPIEDAPEDGVDIEPEPTVWAATPTSHMRATGEQAESLAMGRLTTYGAIAATVLMAVSLLYTYRAQLQQDETQRQLARARQARQHAVATRREAAENMPMITMSPGSLGRAMNPDGDDAIAAWLQPNYLPVDLPVDLPGAGDTDPARLESDTAQQYAVLATIEDEFDPVDAQTIHLAPGEARAAITAIGSEPIASSVLTQPAVTTSTLASSPTVEVTVEDLEAFEQDLVEWTLRHNSTINANDDDALQVKLLVNYQPQSVMGQWSYADPIEMSLTIRKNMLNRLVHRLNSLPGQEAYVLDLRRYYPKDTTTAFDTVSW